MTRAVAAGVVVVFVLATPLGATSDAGGPRRVAHLESWLTPPPVLHFALVRHLPPRTQLVAASCGAPTSCVVFDRSGRMTRYDGKRWAAPRPVSVDPSAGISVSCAAMSLCIAIFASGEVSRWDGATWSTSVAPSGSARLEAVGCAPTGYCAAVDAYGNALGFDDGRWSRTSGDWGSIAALSCVSVAFCASAGPSGVSEWNGASWTEPVGLGATFPYTGVSCVSAAFCMAVDSGGESSTWDGSRWSRPVRIAPRPESPVAAGGRRATGVSCPTATSCVVVDSSGRIAQWRAGHWSFTSIPAARPLTAVSCPRPSFCLVVGGGGSAILGRAEG